MLLCAGDEVADEVAGELADEGAFFTHPRKMVGPAETPILLLRRSKRCRERGFVRVSAS